MTILNWAKENLSIVIAGVTSLLSAVAIAIGVIKQWKDVKAADKSVERSSVETSMSAAEKAQEMSLKVAEILSKNYDEKSKKLDDIMIEMEQTKESLQELKCALGEVFTLLDDNIREFDRCRKTTAGECDEYPDKILKIIRETRNKYKL